MKTERRWIKSLIAETATTRLRMPWERGLRRAAMISRRKPGPLPLSQSLRRTA